MTINLFEPISDFQYILNSLGKTVTINDVSIQAVITNATTPKNTEYDEKYISTISELERGDLVDYNNANWLIINQIADMRYEAKYKGIMRRSDYSIRFNFLGNIKEFPVLIDSKLMKVSEDKYFIIPDGNILVTLQENAESTNIVMLQRFIKLGHAWKVTGIDKSKKGLIILTCEQDLISATDDIVNEIANLGSYIFVVTINNIEPITLTAGDARQLDVTVTLNGTAVQNPSLIYHSSDSEIVSVSETGLITAITEGLADITVQLNNQYYVADDLINVVVEAVITDNYTVQISGANSITIGSSSTYTATFYNNGVQVYDQTGTWTLSNNRATFNSQTGTSASVKAGNTSGVSVNLICTLNSDNSVTALKTINITSLW